MQLHSLSIKNTLNEGGQAVNQRMLCFLWVYWMVLIVPASFQVFCFLNFAISTSTCQPSPSQYQVIGVLASQSGFAHEKAKRSRSQWNILRNILRLSWWQGITLRWPHLIFSLWEHLGLDALALFCLYCDAKQTDNKSRDHIKMHRLHQSSLFLEIR